ncbi:GFA family protein [Sphingomonas sp. MMS24-JH45]
MAVAACHCTRCRRQSGSSNWVNLVVPLETMTVAGDLTLYEDRDTTSGSPVYREFCGTCGSPIRSRLAANPAITAVKAGTLDAPDGYAPTVHVFTCSKLDWVDIPAGVPQFADNPG